jgi:MFS family permease
MTQPLLTLPLLVGIDEAYDDHAFAALMVGLYTAAFAAMMPVTGRLVDRHGGRVILRVWLGFALAALVWTSTALTMRAPVPVVVLSVLALGACLPPAGAVTRAGWPVLVPPAQLRAAYALDSVINEAATIAGPLLAALALTTVTAPAALMVASVAIGRKRRGR